MHDPGEGYKPKMEGHHEEIHDLKEAFETHRTNSEYYYNEIMSAIHRSKKHKERHMSKEVIMNPGYGCGVPGLGGLGGVGLVGLVGLNNLMNPYGAYGGAYGAGGPAAAACDRTAILEQTIATLQGQFASTTAIEGDISDLDTKLSGAISDVAKGLCDIRYENAQQTSTLLAAFSAGVQSVKDQQTQFRFEDLERQLAVAQNGGPIVRAGVFKQCDPCHEQNQMSNINQVLIQVGNGLTALQNAVAALASK